MKIIFGFTSRQLVGQQDWEYPEDHPLGGSETALLRLASEFRRLGHEVEVLNYPPGITEFTAIMAAKACDILINSRLPSTFLVLKRLPGKLNYYWAHDDADEALLAQISENEPWRSIFYQRVSGLFFLSHYQRAAWVSRLGLGAALHKTHLITNPIPYDRFEPDVGLLRARGPRAFYASTPYRGLNYLLDAWPLVRGSVPNAEVHVFSDLRINGAEETSESRALYERAAATPGVVYRGTVGQKALRQAAQQCRVLAYPCSFPETSCIVAMEAMAAGAVVVGTELGALPETAWKNPMEAVTPGWLRRWAKAVARALIDDDYYEDLARQNVEVAQFYDTKLVAQRMCHVFRADLAAQGVRVNTRLQPV